MIGSAVNHAASAQYNPSLGSHSEVAHVKDVTEPKPFARLLVDRMIADEMPAGNTSPDRLADQARSFSESGLLRSIAIAAPFDQTSRHDPANTHKFMVGAIDGGEMLLAADIGSGDNIAAWATARNGAGLFLRLSPKVLQRISLSPVTNTPVSSSPVAANGGRVIANTSPASMPPASESRRSIEAVPKLVGGSALPFAFLAKGDEGLSISLATYRFSQIERTRLHREISSLCLRFGHAFQLYFDGHQQSGAAGSWLISRSGQISGATESCS